MLFSIFNVIFSDSYSIIFLSSKNEKIIYPMPRAGGGPGGTPVREADPTLRSCEVRSLVG